MSARALAFPRLGLSDKDCRFFGPSTRVGDLSRFAVTSVASPPRDWIEADTAITSYQWFLPTIKSMLRLTLMPAGWDSRSARQIERGTIERAILVLAGVLGGRSARPAIVPTVEGGVQAEWHMNALNIEIEFRPNREVLVSVEDLRDDNEWEGQLPSDAARLRPYLSRLDID